MRGPPNSIELNLHRSPFIFISLHVKHWPKSVSSGEEGRGRSEGASEQH